MTRETGENRTNRTEPHISRFNRSFSTGTRRELYGKPRGFFGYPVPVEPENRVSIPEYDAHISRGKILIFGKRAV